MDTFKTILTYICMVTGFPFAWVYVKFFSARPKHSGFLENLGTVVLAIWIGMGLWVVGVVMLIAGLLAKAFSG